LFAPLQYDTGYLVNMMSSPALVRNVALVGHLHSGKTTLADVLVEHTLVEQWDPASSMRYTDARKDEQQRGVSIKATPVSLVLPDTAGKSFLLTVVDTPGHVNFSDEVTASFRAVDGVVLIVDAVEGVMLNTERLVKHALHEHLPIVLVIAKMDRLILELKLPPADAYFKILHTIQEVNALISSQSLPGKPHPELNPAAGNVLFAGASQGWTFSLESFAKVFCSRWAGSDVNYTEFAKRLWGDIYFDAVSGSF
jgi:116 kDa U5 small nuclear ribonucleoprotein component